MKLLLFSQSVSPPALARTKRRVRTTAQLPPLTQPWKYKAIKLEAWHSEATTTATANGLDNPLTIAEYLDTVLRCGSVLQQPYLRYLSEQTCLGLD